MIREIETNEVHFMIENEILYCTYRIKSDMNIEVAKRIVKDRLDFSEGKKYPIFIDFTNLKSATKEAREYMNSKEGGLNGILAGAFLSKSLATTVLVNLYLRINKPEVPARFFTTKEEAINWLNELISNKSI